MALIVKGEQKIISPEEMKILISKNAKKDDPYAGLSEGKKELRKEIQDAKRHREFMGRVEANKTKIIEEVISSDEVIATSEIVSIAVGETVSVVEDTPVAPEVNFESMTKKQIDMWAEENLGIQLDRRHTKAKLIAEIKENL
tara:strand:- start:98 stop:523 length:426 start_codon:yes stop_codon:yes gene_type:complete